MSFLEKNSNTILTESIIHEFNRTSDIYFDNLNPGTTKEELIEFVNDNSYEMFKFSIISLLLSIFQKEYHNIIPYDTKNRQKNPNDLVRTSLYFLSIILEDQVLVQGIKKQLDTHIAKKGGSGKQTKKTRKSRK
jgi:hypothetical protein